MHFAMKALSVSIILCALLLIGCSTSRQIDPADSDSYVMAHVNRNIEGQRVKIRYRDGRESVGMALGILPDSTYYVEEPAGVRRSIATHEIYALDRYQPERGLFKGGGIGAAVGTTIGLATGLALLPLRDPDDSEVSEVHYVGVVGAFGFIVGASVGGGIGLKRAKDKYIYPSISLTGPENAPEADPITPARNNQRSR